MLEGFYCRFIRNRAFLIALTLVGLTTACQESFDQSLEREAREYTNRHCPQEVETGTILDSLVYNPKNANLPIFIVYPLPMSVFLGKRLPYSTNCSSSVQSMT